MNLKNENELLKKEIEKMKEEAENNEMMIREECAEVIENISNKFYGDNNSSSSSLLMKSNSLSSVAEEDNGQDGPVIDILQSARKKKKQDDIQQMVDDLEEKCEDLEEELARSNKEVKTLTMALQASRQESDALLMEGETEEGTEDGGGGVKKLTRIPERWIMLDFLTQLLTAPNTMNVEEFNVEQAGLAKALENISFSSPLRNCAKQFEQNNDELNNNDKVNNIAQALREALKLNNTHNDDDLKEISELKEKLKVRDTEIASLKSSVEVPQQKKEQVVEVLPPQTTDITSSSSSSEVSTENELMACIENSELGKVEEKMDEDIPQESMNPLICADENIKESSSSTVSPPVPKIITQLAPLDPNSPVKAHQPQSEKAMDNSGKYSPSVLGNMSKRIREKAVKKTKKADDKKKVLKASPRRTRSSTLFLRV
jgi:hypothetical protein